MILLLSIVLVIGNCLHGMPPKEQRLEEQTQPSSEKLTQFLCGNSQEAYYRWQEVLGYIQENHEKKEEFLLNFLIDYKPEIRNDEFENVKSFISKYASIALDKINYEKFQVYRAFVNREFISVISERIQIDESKKEYLTNACKRLFYLLVYEDPLSARPNDIISDFVKFLLGDDLRSFTENKIRMKRLLESQGFVISINAIDQSRTPYLMDCSGNPEDFFKKFQDGTIIVIPGKIENIELVISLEDSEYQAIKEGREKLDEGFCKIASQSQAGANMRNVAALCSVPGFSDKLVLELQEWIEKITLPLKKQDRHELYGIFRSDSNNERNKAVSFLIFVEFLERVHGLNLANLTIEGIKELTIAPF